MKKIIKTSLIVIGSVILGVIIGSSFWGHSDSQKSISSESIESSKEQIYTCSMHPQIRQNKPGLCPICSMELISLVEEEHSLDSNAVVMTPSAYALASIQTKIVVSENLSKKIPLLGRVKADERRISSISARFGGRIHSLAINYTGQTVKKGELIGTIYSPELIRAQQELIDAREYKETNNNLYQAVKQKLLLWDITPQQIDMIEKRAKPVINFEILAPISGIISKKAVKEGDYIKEGSPLFEITDLSKVWIVFEAYENDLPWIHAGDKVEYTVQALPNKTHKGVVSYVDPYIDATRRIARVRVEVDNSNNELKPEMYTRGILFSKKSREKKQIFIPKSSVLWTGEKSLVYVKIADDEKIVFIPRIVHLSTDFGNSYLITSGLEEGDEIATNGVFKIDASAQLSGKVSMMNTSKLVSKDDMKEKNMKHSMKMNHKMNSTQTDVTHKMFTVYGNCGMCKSTIEGAVSVLDGVKSVEWDQERKMLHVSFIASKIQLMDIHKAIAHVGYDTDKVKAEDSVYDKLPGCCKYRD